MPSQADSSDRLAMLNSKHYINYISSIRDELSSKEARLYIHFVRWILCCMIAGILWMYWTSNGYAVRILCSWNDALGWLTWVLIWTSKAILDVIEDCAIPSLLRGAKEELSQQPTNEPSLTLVYQRLVRISHAVFVIGAIPATTLPSSLTQNSSWLVLVATMLFGSILAGGVDTPKWVIAAILTSIGLFSGVRKQIILSEDLNIQRWKLSDLVVLGASVLTHSVLDGIQDRILAAAESSKLRIPRVTKTILEWKVLPIAASLAVWQWTSWYMGVSKDSAVYSTWIIALLSPHFVFYDLAKIVFCSFLLGDHEKLVNKNEEELVAGPVDSSTRRALFRACVFLATRGQRRCLFVTDPRISAHVIATSSEKGLGLERFLSQDAFHPIIPTESIDGVQWKRMRLAVMSVLKYLSRNVPLNKRIDQLAASKCASFLQDNQARFDSRRLHELLVHCLYELVFDELADVTTCNLWIEASFHWRGRLAVKNGGKEDVLAAAFQKMVDLLLMPRNRALAQAVQSCMSIEEKASVILQPFIISPMINISDAITSAMALIRGLPQDDPRKCLDFTNPDAARDWAIEALSRYPPFPLLERVLPVDWMENDKDLKLAEVSGSKVAGWTPRAHVFVESDCIASKFSHDVSLFASCPALSASANDDRQESMEFIRFGLGPRACPGKALGLALTQAVIQHAIAPILDDKMADGTFRCDPMQGHKFSGRLLDHVNEPDSSAWYMTIRTFQALAKCAWFGAVYWRGEDTGAEEEQVSKKTKAKAA